MGDSNSNFTISAMAGSNKNVSTREVITNDSFQPPSIAALYLIKFDKKIGYVMEPEFIWI